MNRWSVRQLDRSLGEYATAWDELHARLFRDNPMLDSRYIDALLKHFGDGSERLCIYYTGGIPQAMCILCPRGLGIWATFLPSQAQIGPALLNRPELAQALFEEMPPTVGEIDFLCNDPAFGDLSNADNRKRESRDHALTMDIDLTGSFDDYWTGRSKKLVQNMGRYERRAQADGFDLRLECINSVTSLTPAVTRYANLESSGWKGQRGTAVTVDDVQGAFYLDLMHRFANTNGACVYELWFGDRLAASRLCIVSPKGTVVMLKTTYDETLSKYSPGRLLLQHVIRDTFQRHNGGKIEFYTDANADQSAWSTGQRWIRHVSLYRNEMASDLISLMRASRRIFRREPALVIASHDSTDPNRVEEFRHPSEFPKDVAQLFIEAESISVEFGLTWYQNLIDTVYSDNLGLRFFVLRRDSLPVAVLPLLISQSWRGKQAQALANFYSALYAPVLAPTLKAIELVPLLNAIRTAHGPFASFKFSPMDPQSQSYRRLLNALRSAGMVPFQYFCFGNWYQKLDMPWTDYLAARDGALRSTIKRMGKKFAADGGTLEVIQGGDELDQAIADYETVYSSSWKVPEPFPSFMPGLARACGQRGWLRLGVARLKGQPVAAQVWIVANGKASIFKLAYQEAFKAYAPGTLLTATLMQHVMEQDGVSELDYLIGDDPYKKTWTRSRRERWGVIAYNPRSLRGMIGLLVEIGGRTVRFLASRWRWRRSAGRNAPAEVKSKPASPVNSVL